MTNLRLAIILAFLFLPAILFAREIVVLVVDEDLQIPLEGAVIVLRSSAIQSGQQFVCGENGIALVTLPDNRSTIITITYPGYETLRLPIPASSSAASSGAANEQFTAEMRLGGIMQGQELILEVARPDTSETRSGRSVAISDRDLARTAEIGIIEDVMNSVKLLPGVGYSGMFNAMPSIRGGDPGDLMAVLDGFYIERPYHWLGGVSIFDPKMISAARLSHGVFSARYGHTISGLLEVTSKSPSATETEIEAGIGTSAVTLNLSVPIAGRGGILFMGKATYWDTLIWAAQKLSEHSDNENLNMINSITTAPYIRSAALSMNYRLTADMDWRMNIFFGSDGIGADYENDYAQYETDDTLGVARLKSDYANYQGFFVTGITASPGPKVALRLLGGAGFLRTITNNDFENNIIASYNKEFLDLFGPEIAGYLKDKTYYHAPNINAEIMLDHTIFNAQFRADIDIDLGQGFIAAFGVQELYSSWNQEQDISLDFIEIPVARLSPQRIAELPEQIRNALPLLQDIPGSAIIIPMSYDSAVINHGFTTSAYGLLEHTTPNQRFGTELGLRVDHLYFQGKDFSFHTVPAVNPRLNFDYNILKNRGNIDSLSATIGTGLFSSMNPLISFMEQNMGLESFNVTFNRSWTSVIGFKIDAFERYSFNIESYYKYIFDRAYITADTTSSSEIIPTFHFDGIGKVWGFDLQLQRMESRFWDGWISYTFTWAKYRDPSGGTEGISMGGTDTTSEQWYYPYFHRFHNCNIVVNFKPLQWFHIAARFGFASGQPRRKTSDEVYPYPVLVIGSDGNAVLDDGDNPVIVQKYKRDSWYDENERTAWSLPLDIKFSFFPANKNGRAHMEIYAAAENILSLVYKPSGNTTFNEYTGEEDPGSSSGNFDLPIPMISFGFKWKY